VADNCGPEFFILVFILIELLFILFIDDIALLFKFPVGLDFDGVCVILLICLFTFPFSINFSFLVGITKLGFVMDFVLLLLLLRDEFTCDSEFLT